MTETKTSLSRLGRVRVDSEHNKGNANFRVYLVSLLLVRADGMYGGEQCGDIGGKKGRNATCIVIAALCVCASRYHVLRARATLTEICTSSTIVSS
ncbi:unnamed protein product [Danaus chrysippus]|uniref:(African queen) hypothetical protein n=1 Tax=Danaus chrysippus TaxID=151541 RepID=A0A8J2R8N5_9NEOP|nr:unnamed protein product [Danaus chrysippus]